MKFKAMLPVLVVTAAGMSVQVWAADDASLASLRAELARQQAQLTEQQQLEALAGALEKQAGNTTVDATHVGFYGEVQYNAFRETDPALGKRNFHAHRAVILLSHAFADNLNFYSEL